MSSKSSAPPKALARVEQIAEQVGVSPLTVKISAGAAVGAAVGIAIGHGKRAPFPIEDPPVNTSETAPCYDGDGPVWTCDATAEVPIRFSKAGPASEAQCPMQTVPQLLEQCVKICGNDLALSCERPCPKNDGQGALALHPSLWKNWTWKQYAADIVTAAKGFVAFGTPRFGTITIFGFNAPEWLISSMAALQLGGKVAGIYPTDTVEHCVFKNKLTGATVCVVEDVDKAKMVLDNLDQLPCMKAVVVYSPEAKFEEVLPSSDGSSTKCAYMRWDTMMMWASSLKTDAEIQARVKQVRSGHAANIVFTSGTTGNPKGVMLSHDNICATCRVFLATIGRSQLKAPHRILSYLPLPHVAGYFIDVATPVFLGAEGDSTAVYFARPYDLRDGTFGARLAYARPTLFVGVPRVYEKIAEKLKAIAATVHGPMKTISTWAKAKNLEHMRNRQYGGTGEYPANFGPANFVMGKVRAKLGLDKAQVLVSGAAPITLETLEYFGSLGLQIVETYGMSESSGPTTTNTPQTVKWGSIGFATLGFEVKVVNTMEMKAKGFQPVPACKDMMAPTEAEQGELCFRGRNIMMGYLANPDLGSDHVDEVKKKNEETFAPGGWIMSGDKACMDKNGFFRITGRYKELIITAGGENVAPVPIEDWIKSNYTAISNCMMVGDKKKYNVVLVTLKTKGATGELPGSDELDGEALKIAPGVTSLKAAISDPRVQAYVKKAVEDVNKQHGVVISNACRVVDFRILPRDFSVQTEEFTPTLKLKRSVAMKIWQEVVDQMYPAA
ncbi:unnamed protein product [Amoebophrya sp. A25]|nr:unnamed protein product [Amoebophrya sp. A25]|eukprot:GSA25T00026326001.1